MPIPKFDELFNDILEFLSDKKEYKTRDVKEELSKILDLTDEERQQLIPSGTESIIKNRIGWSITSLKKAGYVESKKWGSVNITELGLKEHKENPNIALDDLMKIPSYQEYVNGSKPNEDSMESGESTPEEEIESAHAQINKKLAGELLENILNNDPIFFERLVVDLLLKMGYGDFRENAGQTTSASNDGGIDGLISQDRLGLDKIAIQAKRYTENVIGRPVLQSFAGALLGMGLTKGVFITTSTFTKGAIEYAQNQANLTIILIDGDKLADLMIEYNVGTFTSHAYEIKRIDRDYFNIGE
jgi:restriction system protein